MPALYLPQCHSRAPLGSKASLEMLRNTKFIRIQSSRLGSLTIWKNAMTSKDEAHAKKTGLGLWTDKPRMRISKLTLMPK